MFKNAKYLPLLTEDFLVRSKTDPAFEQLRAELFRAAVEKL